MNTRETGSAAYEENRKTYIDKRNAVIESAKGEGATENTASILKNGTNEWLKKLDTILSDSKKNIAVDDILTHLLRFATNDNGSSLNKVADRIKNSSEQDLQYLFNEHIKEISATLTKTLPSLTKLIDTDYSVAVHKRK
ncbi:MAG: hypothetical protein ABL867_02160 [Rickettsiales bacterium]